MRTTFRALAATAALIVLLPIGCGAGTEDTRPPQPGPTTGTPPVSTTPVSTTPADEPVPPPATPDEAAGGGAQGGAPPPPQGAPCGPDGRCAEGLTCLTYYGIAGPRGPAFTSCEIPCMGKPDACPEGQRCVTIADGPGQVCRPAKNGGAGAPATAPGN